MRTKARSLLGVSWWMLSLACGTTAGGDADGTDTGSPPECVALDPSAPEQDCGIYEDNRDLPCNGGDSGGGGTDSATDGGGSDGTGGADGGLSEQCAEIATNNDAVVACILQADADGVAFSFAHEYREISIYERSRYHIVADGTMWRSNDDALDLCQYTALRIYGEVSFASCDAWDCILDRVRNAPLVATCDEQNTCGGV